MRTTSGFTIIELIAVIVILGILAAVALPRYLDLSTGARDAACAGWRGSIEGGSAINFAARTANAANGSALTSCGVGNVGTANLGALVAGGLPTTISVTGTFSTTAAGSPVSCTIQYSVSGGACTSVVNVIAIP